MTTLESLQGCYLVEVTSGNVAGFLEHAARLGHQLRDIAWIDDMTIRFIIFASGYQKLRSLAQRQGAKLQIISRKGFYWDGVNLVKRPLFLWGLIFMLLTGIFLPRRIYFVEVQGNRLVETSRILESASEFGIKFGASRRSVRSEHVKNQLIGAIPELGWVGVNTKGSVAVISVREKEIQESELSKTEAQDIAASRDGIILGCSATRGTLLCSPGQAVSEGDILISGTGSVMNVNTVTGASGEVFAATQRKIWVLTPDSAWTRGDNCQQKVNFSLQIGKNLINFFKGSGIYGSSCVKMYSKYVLTLPGGFNLPVALVKWTTQPGEILPETISEDDAQVSLKHFASYYLADQMIAGQIIRKDERFLHSEGTYQLAGDYACTEMIGRVRKEQIGANHGKTD